MMALPPSPAEVHVAVNEPLPRDTSTIVGAFGTVRGVPVTTVGELAPAIDRATTDTEYVSPFRKPEMVHDVVAALQVADSVPLVAVTV